MKTVIIALFSMIVLFTACESKQGEQHYTTILIDTTEEDGYRPTKDELKSFAVIPNIVDGIYYSWIPINDREHNVHRGVYLSPTETGVFYDELSRKQIVDQYYSNIDSLLLGIDSLHFGTDQSQIFRAVLEEARFLMRQSSDDKRLIVFSDLEENSDFFSIRNWSHRKLLKNSGQLQSRFEEHFSITKNESFHGLKIEIHHFPEKDRESSFDAFFLMYANIFESRGAVVTHTVSVITNLKS